MSLKLELDADALRPLIREIVAETLAQVEQDSGPFAGKLAIGEAEAARALSLPPHALRDLRLRGEIMASKGPRRRVLYSREDLVSYLLATRSNGNGRH
jgi:hypothetical protein